MIYTPLDNRWLYNMVDYTNMMMQPLSDLAQLFGHQLATFSESFNMPTMKNYFETDSELPFSFPHIPQQFQQYFRMMAAEYYAFHAITNMYEKPEFGIDEILVDDETVEVVEVPIMRKTFCKLLHFKKITSKHYPVMLLVAPMSGHYATLLRDTVKDLLPYYDVYITDWKNARDVPLSDGAFDFDDFINYVISFIYHLGPDIHVMAVCQPTVPTIIATSLIATEHKTLTPRSVILIGGPIDTTQAPTIPNLLADSRRIDWFQQHVITVVPHRYAGSMRLVYPGFMQLFGFLTMNFEHHQNSVSQAIKHFSEGDFEDAYKIARFYREYLSVMDLTAEFYIQTINTVFQKKAVLKGNLKSRGRPVRPQDITETAILAIEGERDDITGLGQTKAVLDLCKHVPVDKKSYYLQKDVGHYGLFNGRKFREQIIPIIREFTQKYDRPKTTKRSRKNTGLKSTF